MSFNSNINKVYLNIKAVARILAYKFVHSENENINGIVFSMDRPLQLYALLESYFRHCTDPAPLTILFKANSSDYKKGYEEVKRYFKDMPIKFVKEDSFRNNLITIIKNISSKYLFFLVDDNIFKSKFSFADYVLKPNAEKYILSLRLGKHLNYCYTRSISQKLPKFKEEGKFISWNMRASEADWKYAFSVDGHIYLKAEIAAMVNLLSFKAPNSFEASMNVFRYIFWRKKGLCYPESIILNLCLNKVQDENENISGNFSPSELIKIWNMNNKIDINEFNNIRNKSAHLEVHHIPLKKRN